MRAALYHRVSTADQNPALVREELERAATQRGYRIELKVEETGSGARNDRPGLLEILAAARRGKIDCVMVWKIDRFGRSTLDLLGNIRELEACGVRFVAVTQGLDIRPEADSTSRLLLTLLAGVAEFERAIISERVADGIRAARRRGKVLGRPRREIDLVRATELLRETGSLRKVARAMNIPRATLRRALAQHHETES